MLPALFFLFKTVLTVWGLLRFWMNFRLVSVRVFGLKTSYSATLLMSFLCRFLFLWYLCLAFRVTKWYQGNAGLLKRTWICFSSSVFWKIFQENWYKFFFKYLVEFTSETIWSWLFFVGRIDY